MKPSRGYAFVTPVSDIPASSSGVGFGGKTDKQKPEHPYKFKVTAVGAGRPFDGIMIFSEVAVGGVVSLMTTNATLRESKETSGFLIDGIWHLPVDFRDILGIWDEPVSDGPCPTCGMNPRIDCL